MRSGSRAGVALLGGLVLAAPAAPAAGKVFLSQEEALKLAFPAGTTIERRTAFLTEAQQQEARRLARSEEPPDALVTFYVGKDAEGRTIGTAYFDTHRVRTLPETILVLVGPSGETRRVEVLSFSEPEDYLPVPRWYRQFDGRPLDDDLSLKRKIPPVAGATLTTYATTEAVRRVLAIHRVLQQAAPSK